MDVCALIGDTSNCTGAIDDQIRKTKKMNELNALMNNFARIYRIRRLTECVEFVTRTHTHTHTHSYCTHISLWVFTTAAHIHITITHTHTHTHTVAGSHHIHNNNRVLIHI